MLYRSAPRRRFRRTSVFLPPVVNSLLRAALLLCALGCVARAQGLARDLSITAQGEVVVKNLSGRVTIVAEAEGRKEVSMKAESPGAPVKESDVAVKWQSAKVEIEVDGARAERDRIDLTLRVPPRVKVRVETGKGMVDVSGPVREVEAVTDTGTIRADVPLDSVRYNFRWTASRARFYSEVPLGKVKEKRGGAFELSGRLGEKDAEREKRVALDLQTERGVILFGVDPASVPSDLRERQLTEAARAIIRSGNQDLIESIRKITPRFVGQYEETLPPSRGNAPNFTTGPRRTPPAVEAAPQLMKVSARVTDRAGRAIGGLRAADFTVVENGEARPVVGVEQTRAPFNIVLLLDVSGSVEERLDFIRKAALQFVDTVGPQDRIAIISFRDDVQLISGFTTDRRLLQERVRDIEAGGGTALYDALAYTLVHTLRPLRGERTAVVVLSDGDDTRSFVPFPEVLEAVLESGALIYPLYIPSGLIPADGLPAPDRTLDPTRTRYLALTSRADEEGRRLAQVSGGVYYPVTRIDELQRAYTDVVTQLRTAYTISYNSTLSEAARTRSVRVRVAREGASVQLSPAAAVTLP